jgi:hypothetical protein
MRDWAEARIEQAAERMLRDYSQEVAVSKALNWIINTKNKKRKFWIEVYKYIKDKQ